MLSEMKLRQFSPEAIRCYEAIRVGVLDFRWQVALDMLYEMRWRQVNPDKASYRAAVIACLKANRTVELDMLYEMWMQQAKEERKPVARRAQGQSSLDFHLTVTKGAMRETACVPKRRE